MSRDSINQFYVYPNNSCKNKPAVGDVVGGRVTFTVKITQHVNMDEHAKLINSFCLLYKVNRVPCLWPCATNVPSLIVMHGDGERQI